MNPSKKKQNAPVPERKYKPSVTGVSIHEVMTEHEIDRFAELVKKKAVRLDILNNTELNTTNEKETASILKQTAYLMDEVGVMFGFLIAARNMKSIYESHLEETVEMYEKENMKLNFELLHCYEVIQLMTEVAIAAIRKSATK